MLMCHYETYLYDLKAPKWLFLVLATFGRFRPLLASRPAKTPFGRLFSNPAYCDPKVTYSYPNVTYSDPKVTYSDPTHLLLPPPTSPGQHLAISQV